QTDPQHRAHGDDGPHQQGCDPVEQRGRRGRGGHRRSDCRRAVGPAGPADRLTHGPPGRRRRRPPPPPPPPARRSLPPPPPRPPHGDDGPHQQGCDPVEQRGRRGRGGHRRSDCRRVVVPAGSADRLIHDPPVGRRRPHPPTPRCGACTPRPPPPPRHPRPRRP